MAYLYDGQMPVCEQEFVGSTLRTSRVNFLGARGIEAVLAIDHTRGNQARLSWLLYDGHGNLVRVMASDYTLSGFQWRGVWGEVQSSLGAGRGYCANLGHSEDETGLVYMRARYYEPATGRFISEDPARDGVNWYLYADGNPVNKVDDSGESPKSEFLKWVLAEFLVKLTSLLPKNSPYLKIISAIVNNITDAMMFIRGAVLLGAAYDSKVAAAAAGALSLVGVALMFIAIAQLGMLELLIRMDLEGQEGSERWRFIDQYGGIQLTRGWGIDN